MTLLNPSSKPVTYGKPPSAGPAMGTGLLNLQEMIQSMIHQPPPIPQVPQPAPVGGGVPGAIPGAPQPGERLQIERERNALKKSSITPRHLGMSGEELTPQNPFTSGFFVNDHKGQGLQTLAPSGDYSLLAHHTDTSPVNPFVGAFNPHTEGINPRYQPQAPSSPVTEAQPSQVPAQTPTPTAPLPPGQPSRNSYVTSNSPVPASSEVLTNPSFNFANSFTPPVSTEQPQGLHGIQQEQPPAPLGPNPNIASAFEAPPNPNFHGGIVPPVPTAPAPLTGAQALLQRIQAGRAARNPSQVSPSVGPNPYSPVF